MEIASGDFCSWTTLPLASTELLGQHLEPEVRSSSIVSLTGIFSILLLIGWVCPGSGEVGVVALDRVRLLFLGMSSVVHQIGVDWTGDFVSSF